MADFPFGPDKILRDGFNETPAERTIRSNMDVGPAKVRRRTFAAVTPVGFNMLLTSAEWNTLYNFYLNNDATVFYFIHPRTNQSVRARFADVPNGSFNETMWNVDVKLEIMP